MLLYSTRNSTSMQTVLYCEMSRTIRMQKTTQTKKWRATMWMCLWMSMQSCLLRLEFSCSNIHKLKLMTQHQNFKVPKNNSAFYNELMQQQHSSTKKRLQSIRNLCIFISLRFQMRSSQRLWIIMSTISNTR